MLDVHRVRADLPAVKIADDIGRARAGRPHGELNAVLTVAGAMVCAHPLIMHVVVSELFR